MGLEEVKGSDVIGDKKPHSWRDWHEREIPVKIFGEITDTGIKISVDSQQLKVELPLNYPKTVWDDFGEENKTKFLNNVTYSFTAHLPFLLKGNIRLEYTTGYPQVFSWANQCFLRFLSAYWYVYKGQRGTRIFPLLKTLLNSRAVFSETADYPPDFSVAIDNNVIIPFTFGKDSLLTYKICKEIGLNPLLVYFNEPTEEYAGKHKMSLIEEFQKMGEDKVHYVENPLGKLREYGDGWFGWELALTSWSLLCLPFAFQHKAGYIIFSNEASCNDFFYDEDGYKVFPDYEQSGQATEELSILTQSLSEGEVCTTTFLQGLYELAIVCVLKNKYYKDLRYLMSCWAENSTAKDSRWCHACSKCFRIYLFLVASGVDPAYVGFEKNLLTIENKNMFSMFGMVSGTGYDSFGTNRDECLFAFYLAYLQGNRDSLVVYFKETELFSEAEDRFSELLNRYFTLQKENITPPQWKEKVDNIFEEVLKKVRKEFSVKNNNL